MAKKRKVSSVVNNGTTTSTGGAITHPFSGNQNPNFPPLFSTYNDKIRPILDAVDKLRRLNVTQQGIPLPTIVVVGDQSSGKSSVLESLAGISLPRGQGLLEKVTTNEVNIGLGYKINERLNDLVLELNKLPQNLTSIPDAMMAFTHIIGSLKETLQKILIRGEFDDALENKQMCCNARLAEMIDEFSNELHTSVKFSENFLSEEIRVLEEANGIQLPNFLLHYVFLYLLQRKVSNISDLSISFVNKVCGYLESICVKVLIDHCGNYPQFLP
ncbi:hypothetical protein L1987_55676 [Smallanthus sonchifolius]|uniref:Uncharacterized protein n=1 Tax=Smallanthus sonchifolius TaxID=185202 RepID=A0ACB9EAL2_9ASTR|nr:hypothetical protein L1987_55676 [Smallanthus sonchifolius]